MRTQRTELKNYHDSIDWNELCFFFTWIVCIFWYQFVNKNMLVFLYGMYVYLECTWTRALVASNTLRFFVVVFLQIVICFSMRSSLKCRPQMVQVTQLGGGVLAMAGRCFTKRKTVTKNKMQFRPLIRADFHLAQIIRPLQLFSSYLRGFGAQKLAGLAGKVVLITLGQIF